ncbi:MAG: N-6 DNA methylase [Sphingobacteriales bacterium]|nr:N-6 DNA methylase [Sphingobacteriales bacterium]
MITTTTKDNDTELLNWSDNILNDQQLELFFLNTELELEKTNSILKKENKKNLMGQVFTPHLLAKFMVSLFQPDLKENNKILDPCIGPNTFLSYLDNTDSSIQITGVELDESLISENIKEFYKKANRQLILDSFFNLPLANKFDFIVQNPPYVRQELMMNGENSKLLALKSLSSLSQIIPAKSNLYVYFLLKSIFHLADHGRMIAVIYDSWLYSDFGKVLKEAFVRLGSIEGIYHFKKNAFPDAEVGATVIDFKRIINTKEKNKLIKLYSLKTVDEVGFYGSKIKLPFKQIPVQEFFTYRFSEETVIDFKIDLFKPIEKINSQPIQRGISSIANKFFIQQQKTFEESIPFVKDVTSITSFNIKNELFYLLALNGHISEKTQKHLDNAKKEILAEGEKFKALKEQIEHNPNWYKVQLKKPGNLLFNYYLRKNIDFLLNEELHYSSDNFYILNVEKHLLANFAILNSSFTRISVLLHSRNQGNGLRKIQLYEFKDIPVIDSNKLSNETIAQLEVAAEKLKSIDRFSEGKDEMINEIDEILIKEYNLQSKIQITTTQLYNDIRNIFSIN